MLKARESYNNEKTYVRAFFLHNSHVEDYPIDPLVGSFIRVVRPREDQPMGDGKGYYTRPQVLFMNSLSCSQFHELTDMPDLKRQLDLIATVISDSNNPREMTLSPRDTFSASAKNILFKTNNYDKAYLLANPVNRTKEVMAEIISNLLDSMDRIIKGLPPKDKILKLEGMMMTTMNYPGNGVRSPIVITGRKKEEDRFNYIILRKSGQSMTIPNTPEVSAAEYIQPFLDAIEETGAALLADPSLERVVRFINEQDVNMEYVNARFVEMETGPTVHVMFNSDRYPANQKMTLVYRPDFHQQLKATLIEFCNQFSAL